MAFREFLSWYVCGSPLLCDTEPILEQYGIKAFVFCPANNVMVYVQINHGLNQALCFSFD
jgi:hypothetical protein